MPALSQLSRLRCNQPPPPLRPASQPTTLQRWINGRRGLSFTIPIITSRRCRARLRPSPPSTSRLPRSSRPSRFPSPIPSRTDEALIRLCRVHSRREEEATDCRPAESRRRAFTTRERRWQRRGRRLQVRWHDFFWHIHHLGARNPPACLILLFSISAPMPCSFLPAIPMVSTGAPAWASGCKASLRCWAGP